MFGGSLKTDEGTALLEVAKDHMHELRAEIKIAVNEKEAILDTYVIKVQIIQMPEY